MVARGFHPPCHQTESFEKYARNCLPKSPTPRFQPGASYDRVGRDCTHRPVGAPDSRGGGRRQSVQIGQAWCFGTTRTPEFRAILPIMSRDHPLDFACPSCQARYKIVRIKSEAGAVYQALQCTVCKQQLAPTEDNNILRYFLISVPRKIR